MLYGNQNSENQFQILIFLPSMQDKVPNHLTFFLDNFNDDGIHISFKSPFDGLPKSFPKQFCTIETVKKR